MFQVDVSKKYGPLVPGLSVKFSQGYNVIVGKNNVGKTSFLQYAFVRLFETQKDGLQDTLCYIPKNRDFIAETTETQGGSLFDFNLNLASAINDSPLPHHRPDAYDFSKQYTFLLNNTDLHHQLTYMKDAVKNFGRNYSINGPQKHYLDNIQIPNHGSGLRSYFPISAALSDPNMRYIFIDEPEVSLEASLQKQLKQELLDITRKRDITVIVTTHSHLFLNHEVIENNFIMDDRGELSITPFKDKSQYADVAFRMLGNSFSDLYLPNNFLFVEGASDQFVCERVAELLNISSYDVRIITCGGLQEVEPTVAAFEHAFRSVLEHKSPYSRTLVALVDKPKTEEVSKIKFMHQLETFLAPDRFFQLPVESLEEYFSMDLYLKAGLNKNEELEKIKKAKTYGEKSVIKRFISERISKTVEVTDLPQLQVIVDAVKKASLK